MSGQSFRQAERAFQQGDLDKAGRCLAQALVQSPNDHRALALMAEIRLLTGDVTEAFALYTRAVNAAPRIRPYKKRFLELAARGLEITDSEQLESAIVACLKTPDLAGLIENWASLLMANREFNAAYGLASRRPFDPANRMFFSRPMDLRPLFRPLFLEGMKSHVVCNPLFEEFITYVRRQLLDQLGAEDGRLTIEGYVTLASALSHYAFLSDFILDETQDERERVDQLRARIETESAAAKSPAAIAIIACYRPLCALSNARAILATFAANELLGDVVRMQIADYFALSERALSIASVTRIDDASLEVRRQYEDFPYPRWKDLSLDRVAEDWRNHGMSQTVERLLPKRQPRLLVAGCGTGRDALILAAMVPGASVTAVDISRTSLAYAALKAKEHGCRNITFLQGDILHLATIGQTFDYVCCTGVLHHIDNPAVGLKILCDLLTPDGVMLIGLYSRLARNAVIAAQELVRRGGYSSTREGILRFRRESPRALDADTLKRLCGLRDYYHMSMYRDLLFPAKEHRFDLLQIRDILNQIGLCFEGFYVSAEIAAKYRTMFPHDPKATDLESWNRFELLYQQTFESMYIFWCRKAKS